MRQVGGLCNPVIQGFVGGEASEMNIYLKTKVLLC